MRQPVRAAARHPEPARSYTRQGTGTHSGRAALTRLLSSALRPGSPGRAGRTNRVGVAAGSVHGLVHVYSAGRRPTRRLVVHGTISASGRRAAPASSSSWHGSCSRTRYDASTHESGREGSDEKRRASHARSSGSAGWGGAAGSLTKQRRDRRRGRGAAARGRRDGPWFSSPVTPNAYQTQSDALGSLAPPALHPTSRRT